MDQKQYVDEKKVSKITGLALQTLRNHRSRGAGIPYHKIGRSIRYELHDVYQFFGSKRIETQDL